MEGKDHDLTEEGEENRKLSYQAASGTGFESRTCGK
jgi:hypothetical protein